MIVRFGESRPDLKKPFPINTNVSPNYQSTNSDTDNSDDISPSHYAFRTHYNLNAIVYDAHINTSEDINNKLIEVLDNKKCINTLKIIFSSISGIITGVVIYRYCFL
jgi:hypothetical protein